MSQKRVHFGFTTPQQRRLLFEVWEETGSVKTACEKAHVSKQTFYYWLPRFEAEGYAGLENRSSAPREPHRTPEEIAKRVVEMKDAHPDWGKRRIADELAKANSWVPLVSPNTVRRILRDAGLWEEQEEPAQKGAKLRSATRKFLDRP